MAFETKYMRVDSIHYKVQSIMCSVDLNISVQQWTSCFVNSNCFAETTLDMQLRGGLDYEYMRCTLVGLASRTDPGSTQDDRGAMGAE